MTTDRKVRGLYEDVGELVESRRGVDLREFESYADAPVRFAEEVLHVDPWSRQEEILTAVRDRPQVHVQGGNAVGKDFASAVAALWWTFCRRGRVLVTAAVQRQLTDVFMGEVGRLWRGAEGVPGELYRSALRVPGVEHAGITTFTSTAASKLTGFHAPRVLAVLSEAQAVEPFAWEAMMANATGEGDRLLACGNPLRPQGRFYQNAGADAWHTVKIPVMAHPNLRADTERHIPGGPSEDFVDRMAREWGRDSEQFEARVSAEFPTDSVEGLIRRSWIERSVENRRKAAEGDALDFHADGADVVVAVDPARAGPDATACCIREGKVVREIRTWRTEDTMQTVEKVRDLLHELAGPESPRIERVVVDEIGVGGGIVDRLQEALKGREFEHRGMQNRRRSGGRAVVARSRRRRRRRITASEVEVDGFNSSRKADDSERFANLRAAAFWRVRERLEEHDLLLPDDPQLTEELAEIRWQVTGSGQVQIEDKEGLKARLGRSPDRADALAMSMAPEVAPGSSGEWWFA